MAINEELLQKANKDPQIKYIVYQFLLLAKSLEAIQVSLYKQFTVNFFEQYDLEALYESLKQFNRDLKSLQSQAKKFREHILTLIKIKKIKKENE